MKLRLKKSVRNGLIVTAMFLMFIISVADVIFNGYHDDFLMITIYLLFYLVAFMGLRL